MLKSILLAILLPLIFEPAQAQTYVAEGLGGDRAVLTQRECPKPVLDLLRPEVHSLFKLAEVRSSGVDYAACWRMRPDAPAVLIVFDDGDFVNIPLAEFKPGAGI